MPSEAAEAAAEPAPSPAAPPPAFDIRPWQFREDLERAAWLRAEAYYEKRSVGRFKASFIKQFAGQELYALLRRTKGAQPLCVTLVATRGSPAAAAAAPAEAPAARGAGGCLGTLDVRLLDGAVAAFIDAYGGLRWPEGVPRGAAPAAYVSNVVVAEAQRGRGLGRGLVGAAAELARERWRAGKVYCHVEVGNEPALALYRACGFSQLGEELAPEEEGLGRRRLLCLALAEPDPTLAA
ncbi:hypothetical protein CHLNCDRAFT_134568 [Chlorella variabilis]|uniref:N-acetyltransferase domain-containing protein n=1 Tax=Chlorella variabilis TaxID=554065 RepID=E1ZG81_CHLVA|nr:hypothetical protein CHLNCDRAFT_134568 [Chlorella variabilis]EFN55246.1 hypothetical protein CHLNCDRAFT_134568 [Chlorella variabilis]|eukprot:XP_005847348.1 hypothetical protein CHLNCDRAFT_134568 [Chlorella variabilis]